MIIGVTGKSGSGKTTYSNKLVSEGKADLAIHVDDIAHNAMTYPDVKAEIKKVFGLDVDTVDRKTIGDIYFNNRDSKRQLDIITWKYIKQIIDDLLESSALYSKDRIVVIDWILLPQTHYWKMCDKKILLKAKNDEDRLKKILERDNISTDYLKSREAASIEYDESDMDEIIITDYEEKD